ncbi:MAG: hypothetical protein ACYDEF_09280 [Methanosarcina sp.]
MNNKNKLAKKIRNGLPHNTYGISIIIIVGAYEKQDELIEIDRQTRNSMGGSCGKQS